MVGKPEDDRAGSASPTPGLNALDQEREASLADEGGASGAHLESQDIGELRRLAAELPVAHLQSEPRSASLCAGLRPGAVVATAVAAGVVGAVLYKRWR
jgi:hypothetical protein